MKKNNTLLYAGAGAVGLFLVYYYNKNKNKYFNSTGGYGYNRYEQKVEENCGGYTTGCKTVFSCAKIKKEEIACELRKNSKEYDKLLFLSKLRNVPVENLVKKQSNKIFTDNGKRNNKESLDYFKIKPILDEDAITLPPHPEIQAIIDEIKSNPDLYNPIKAKASEKKIKEERLLLREANKISRKRNAEKQREIRRQIQQARHIERLKRQMWKAQNINRINPPRYIPNLNYIEGYGNVDVFYLTPSAFDTVWKRLQNDLENTFKRLPQGTYTTDPSLISGAGTSGGGMPMDSCGEWGTFNWSYCNMLRQFRRGGALSSGSGGYAS
jgi:hypothetical protein